jgi:hypothetical protein
MEKIVDNILIIRNNIFVLTPLLVSFYKNYQGRKNDLLLSYLILPVVLNQKCIESLQNINVKSNLIKLVSNKECMAGFSDRFEFYEQITNQCIQYAIDCGYIRILENLQVQVINDEIQSIDPALAASMNLSSKLFKLFKSLDIVHIYYAFGIKSL